MSGIKHEIYTFKNLSNFSRDSFNWYSFLSNSSLLCCKLSIFIWNSYIKIKSDIKVKLPLPLLQNKITYKNLFEQEINGSIYSRMDQVKFFKGSLPQIWLSAFLNTLTQMHVYKKQEAGDDQSICALNFLPVS